MVLSRLNQLQIFQQLCLLELLRLLANLGLLTEFGMLVFFTNLGLWIFGLTSSFLSNRQPQLVLDGKSSQEYPVDVGVPQGSILSCTISLLFITDPPDDFICNIAIYADDATLLKCDQASDLWQQLELASELESYLQDTLDCGRKWYVGFNAGKSQEVSFDQCDNTGAIDGKTNGSVLKEN